MAIRRRSLYLALLLSSIVCASASWSILSLTIVANCLERRSSSLMIGILTSIWAIPFLVAAPAYTRIICRLGAKPCVLAGMFANSLSFWIFPLFPYDWVWLVLQVMGGTMLGHFWLICESWLNLFSTGLTRARVTSCYGIAPPIGYAIGAGIYMLIGSRGRAPFLIASAFMLIGTVPILFIPKGTRLTVSHSRS